jgi:hypothetical protein
MMYLLCFFFVFLVVLQVQCQIVVRTKYYNDKTIKYVRTNRTERVSVIGVSGTTIYLTNDVNYSRSLIAQKYSDLEFIISPRGCSLLDNTNCVNNSVELQNRYNEIRLNLTRLFNITTVKGMSMIKTGYLINCAAPSIVHVDLRTYTDIHLSDVGNLTMIESFIDKLDYDTSIVQSFTILDWYQEIYRVLVVRVGFRQFNVQLHYIPYGNQSLLISSGDTNYTSPPNLTDGFVVYFAGGGNITFYRTYTDTILNALTVPSEIDFFKNKEPRRFYTLHTANFHVGGYDMNLQLTYPFTPNGVPGGGRILFATGEYPHVPVAIPPNPLYKVYKDDCIDFYPKAATFYGWGFSENNGALHDRMIADQYRCMAPFYAPELVIDITTGSEVQDERFRQCYMLGGSLANQARDVCTRPIAWARCREGHLYFGGQCYYKFDPIKEPWAKVIASESLQVCRQIFDKSEPLPNANYDLKLWLARHYVYWNKAQGTEYRVPVLNENCDCYSLNGTESSVQKCNCNSALFPICVYHEKHYEVIDRWVSHHPMTIAVLRDGQKGAPWNGEEFLVVCENGSGGSHCHEPVCG